MNSNQDPSKPELRPSKEGTERSRAGTRIPKGVAAPGKH